jgi:uncharacterized protein YdeI (YjbR/CyaY-like superfamily)
VSTGVVHRVPADIKRELLASPRLLSLWNGLTPLARNEWICWVTSVKKIETRQDHLKRMGEDLVKGKRRPCCWPGCPHREKTGKISKKVPN